MIRYFLIVPLLTLVRFGSFECGVLAGEAQAKVIEQIMKLGGTVAFEEKAAVTSAHADGSRRGGVGDESGGPSWTPQPFNHTTTLIARTIVLVEIPRPR